MEKIVLTVNDKSKMSFLMKLLKELKFVSVDDIISAEELEELQDIKVYDKAKARNEKTIPLSEAIRLRKQKRHA